MYSCILWSKKIECTANLAKMVLFQKSGMRQKVLLRRKVEGCVILTSLSQTWIHEIAWSFVQSHQLDCTLYWTVCFCCKPHTALLSQCFLITPRMYVRMHNLYTCLFVFAHVYEYVRMCTFLYERVRLFVDWGRLCYACCLSYEVDAFIRNNVPKAWNSCLAFSCHLRAVWYCCVKSMEFLFSL